MLPDFTRQRSQLPGYGPDVEAASAPLAAAPELMQPPNMLNSGSSGLSTNSVNSLAGLGKAGIGFMQHRGDVNAAKKMTDSPMPIKRPPFQTLGPPMMEA